MLVQTLEVSGLKLAVSIAGGSGQPALVLLHDWPHSRKIYDGVIEEPGTRHFTSAFDLQEIGDSRGAPPSAEKKSIVVAGLDVGVMIAFAAAGYHGDRIVGAVPMNTVIPGLHPWTKAIANPDICILRSIRRPSYRSCW